MSGSPENECFVVDDIAGHKVDENLTTLVPTEQQKPDNISLSENIENNTVAAAQVHLLMDELTESIENNKIDEIHFLEDGNVIFGKPSEADDAHPSVEEYKISNMEAENSKIGSAPLTICEESTSKSNEFQKVDGVHFTESASTLSSETSEIIDKFDDVFRKYGITGFHRLAEADDVSQSAGHSVSNNPTEGHRSDQVPLSEKVSLPDAEKTEDVTLSVEKSSDATLSGCENSKSNLPIQTETAEDITASEVPDSTSHKPTESKNSEEVPLLERKTIELSMPSEVHEANDIHILAREDTLLNKPTEEKTNVASSSLKISGFILLGEKNGDADKQPDTPLTSSDVHASLNEENRSLTKSKEDLKKKKRKGHDRNSRSKSRNTREEQEKRKHSKSRSSEKHESHKTENKTHSKDSKSKRNPTTRSADLDKATTRSSDRNGKRALSTEEKLSKETSSTKHSTESSRGSSRERKSESSNIDNKIKEHKDNASTISRSRSSSLSGKTSVRESSKVSSKLSIPKLVTCTNENDIQETDSGTDSSIGLSKSDKQSEAEKSQEKKDKSKKSVAVSNRPANRNTMLDKATPADIHNKNAPQLSAKSSTVTTKISGLLNPRSGNKNIEEIKEEVKKIPCAPPTSKEKSTGVVPSVEKSRGRSTRQNIIGTPETSGKFEKTTDKWQESGNKGKKKTFEDLLIEADMALAASIKNKEKKKSFEEVVKEGKVAAAIAVRKKSFDDALTAGDIVVAPASPIVKNPLSLSKNVVKEADVVPIKEDLVQISNIKSNRLSNVSSTTSSISESNKKIKDLESNTSGKKNRPEKSVVPSEEKKQKTDDKAKSDKMEDKNQVQSGKLKTALPAKARVETHRKSKRLISDPCTSSTDQKMEDSEFGDDKKPNPNALDRPEIALSQKSNSVAPSQEKELKIDKSLQKNKTNVEKRRGRSLKLDAAVPVTENALKSDLMIGSGKKLNTIEVKVNESNNDSVISIDGDEINKSQELDNSVKIGRGRPRKSDVVVPLKEKERKFSDTSNRIDKRENISDVQKLKPVEGSTDGDMGKKSEGLDTSEKRGRGRPRKSESAIPLQESDNTKTRIGKSENAIKVQYDISTDIDRRGRSRSRKSDTALPYQEKDMKTASNTKSMNVKTENITEILPSKSNNDSVEKINTFKELNTSSKVDVVNTAKKSNKSGNLDISDKRGRGRPRKSETETSSGQQTKLEKALPVKATSEIFKRKRGRLISEVSSQSKEDNVEKALTVEEPPEGSKTIGDRSVVAPSSNESDSLPPPNDNRLESPVIERRGRSRKSDLVLLPPEEKISTEKNSKTVIGENTSEVKSNNDTVISTNEDVNNSLDRSNVSVKKGRGRPRKFDITLPPELPKTDNSMTEERKTDTTKVLKDVSTKKRGRKRKYNFEKSRKEIKTCNSEIPEDKKEPAEVSNELKVDSINTTITRNTRGRSEKSGTITSQEKLQSDNSEVHQSKKKTAVESNELICDSVDSAASTKASREPQNDDNVSSKEQLKIDDSEDQTNKISDSNDLNDESVLLNEVDVSNVSEASIKRGGRRTRISESTISAEQTRTDIHRNGRDRPRKSKASKSPLDEIKTYNSASQGDQNESVADVETKDFKNDAVVLADTQQSSTTRVGSRGKSRKSSPPAFEYKPQDENEMESLVPKQTESSESLVIDSDASSAQRSRRVIKRKVDANYRYFDSSGDASSDKGKEEDADFPGTPKKRVKKSQGEVEGSASKINDGSSQKRSRPPKESKRTSSKLLKLTESLSPTPDCRVLTGDGPRIILIGGADNLRAVYRTVKELGGHIVHTPAQATHLVTDKLRRTVKVLCMLAQGKPIVRMDWIEHCKEAKAFEDYKPFLIEDQEVERQFDFSLSKSLAMAAQQRLFQGYQIHATSNVLPSPFMMRDIIECAGGKYIPKMPTGSSPDGKTVVISTPWDMMYCREPIPAGVPVVGAEYVLTGVLKQDADIPSYLLS